MLFRSTLCPVPAIDTKEFAKLLTLNLIAQQQLIAAFDPMLRSSGSASVIGVTSTVGQTPRAYWGGYGCSKAALDMLLLTYAQEVANISGIRVAIVNPGATATKMRAKAFPGEDPDTLKPPSVVGDAIARLVIDGFETGYQIRVEG